MECSIWQDEDDIRGYAATALVYGGQMIQLRDGRAAIASVDIPAGGKGAVALEGIAIIPKTTGIVILDGGKVFWDYSANKAHFKPVNDLDFYAGTAIGDAASSDTTMKVNLNRQPIYNLDLARDPFTTAVVGTQAAGGLGYPRRLGGSNALVITATNEAQKVDALGDDGFSILSKPIVEMRVNVIDGDAAGAADFNIGIAIGTHATDADSITNAFLLHIDGNSTALKFQSKDGTTTVNATDSTKVYTAGTPFEVWLDCRNPAAPVVYVDGVAVLTSTVFGLSASVATWYLLAHVEKTASTDTFNAKVDWLRARMANE